MAFPVRYHHVQLSMGMIDVFYREAGDRAKPAVLLLHGFPTSSHMFRNLIPALAPNAYVIAPDLPGFGITKLPVDGSFQLLYTFDNLAVVVQELIAYLGLKKYVIYVMGYGAPTGFHLALKHPDSILGFIVQNRIPYKEDSIPFWVHNYLKERTPAIANPFIPLCTLDDTKSLYTDGARDIFKVSPDNWFNDYYFLQQPGREKIQVDLLYHYLSNLDMHSKFSQLLCKYKFPTLIVWGTNDALLGDRGADEYLKDLPEAEFYFFNGGHFLLEEYLEEISAHINRFVKDTTLCSLHLSSTFSTGLR